MELLLQFLEDWFTHPLWWFNATAEDDQYLTEKYHSLCNEPILNNGTLKEKIGWVLVHDQLIRHVVRHHQLDSVLIQKHLSHAIDLSHQIIEEAECIHEEKLTKGQLSWKEWCFVMLPFRHGKQIHRIDEIRTCLWYTIKYDHLLMEEDRHLLARYLKATYQRYPKLPIHQANGDKSQWMTHNQVCEYMPFTTISCKSILYEDPPYAQIRESKFGQLFKDVESPALVSLSGGVDSMVCLLAMKAWNKKIGAIHINYDNRKQCAQEQKLVEDWCAYLNVPCWTRCISEIHRKECMSLGFRDLYESYTKEVRFNAYLQTWEAMGEKDLPQVILGHHLDDCMENVLTNLMACTKYNDLFGMEYKRPQMNCWMIRPLLTIHKRDIIHFAHQYNVPYLKDSTPEWSSRGQLRDSVLPTLEQWIGDSNLVQGFTKLNQTCQAMSKIVQFSVNQWKQQFQSKTINQWSATLNWEQIPRTAIFYRELCSQMWNCYPTQRSIEELLFRLSKIEQQWNKLQRNVSTSYPITKNLQIQWIKRNSDEIEWIWRYTSI